MGFFSKIGHKLSGAVKTIGSKFSKKNMHSLGSKVSHAYKAVRHGLNVADPYLSKLAAVGGAILGGAGAVAAGFETGGATWGTIGTAARSGAAAGTLAYQTAKQGLIALDQGQRAIGKANKAYNAGDHDAAFKHGVDAATHAENAGGAVAATKKNVRAAQGHINAGLDQVAARRRVGNIASLGNTGDHFVMGNLADWSRYDGRHIGGVQPI